jgi:hypothetical protein
MQERYKACLILYPEIAMWKGQVLHSKLLQATNVEGKKTS